MHRPSRNLKLAYSQALGEKEYLAGMITRKDKMLEVQRGVESPFGQALILAFDDIIKAGMHKLVDTPSWHIFKINKIKAEIQIARFMKGKLMAYVANAEAFEQELERFNNNDS